MSYSNNTKNSLPIQYEFDLAQQVLAFHTTATFDPLAAFLEPTAFDPTTAIDPTTLDLDLPNVQNPNVEKLSTDDVQPVPYYEALFDESLHQSNNGKSPALPDLNDYSSWPGQDLNSVSLDTTSQQDVVALSSALGAFPLQASDPYSSVSDALFQQEAGPSMEAFGGFNHHNDLSLSGQDLQSILNALTSTRDAVPPSMETFERFPHTVDQSLSTFSALHQQAAGPSRKAFAGFPQQLGASAMDASHMYLQQTAGSSSSAYLQQTAGSFSSASNMFNKQQMLPSPPAMNSNNWNLVGSMPRFDMPPAAPSFFPQTPVLFPVDLPAMPRARSEGTSSDTSGYSSSYGSSSNSVSSQASSSYGSSSHASSSHGSSSDPASSHASSSRAPSSRQSSSRTGSSRSKKSYASHRGKKPYERVTRSQSSRSSEDTPPPPLRVFVEEFSLTSERRERIQLDPENEHWLHSIDWDNHPPSWNGKPIPRMQIDEVYWYLNKTYNLRPKQQCLFNGCGKTFEGKGMKNHILSSDHIFLRASCRKCRMTRRPNEFTRYHADTDCEKQGDPAPVRGHKPRTIPRRSKRSKRS